LYCSGKLRSFISMIPVFSRLRAALCSLSIAAFALAQASAQQPPAFTQVIVFGDSLSDDGNVRHRADSKYSIPYPGGNFNYSEGRFTNSSDTHPASRNYRGVWHEQLARTFLNIPRATNSLDRGLNYAFGGATTENGTQQRLIVPNPGPAGGDLTLAIDNMGRQVSDYLAAKTPDPNALYIVWGGGNDLFDDRSEATINGAASNMGALVARLAKAGARYFLVPNVPPLGAIPSHSGEHDKAESLNAASAAYRLRLNAVLDETTASLGTQGISVQLYRFDVWRLFLGLINDPLAYGFTNVRDPAQGESGSADKFLFWDDIHPTTAGHYQIARAAYEVLSRSATPVADPLNISTRANVGTGENVLIGGLVVSGNLPKRVIIRAIGPSLNVGSPLVDPELQLFDQSGLIAENDNWKDTQADEINSTGVAPTDDRESAIVRTLDPGSYTAIVSGKNGSGGVGLVEAYDLNPSTNSFLANASTRGVVGTGDNVLIGGFIIASGGQGLVVVRAIGPSLTSFGVANALDDPTLDLYDANGAAVAHDDDWKETQPLVLKATTLQPADDREAAIFAALNPGNYTAVVRGKDNSTGVGLVEVYNLH
jgi:phospholipase/lecithinase/hemolysin